MPASRARTLFAVITLGLLLCTGFMAFHMYRQPTMHTEPPSPGTGERTVDDRVQEYGEIVRQRLEPNFARAHVPYPPAALTFIGLKEEKTLEIYAAGPDRRFRFIRAYPILAASGHAGPKFREGDGQVPEGLYRIESLNPNSLFHVSLRVNYPNEFDRSKATADNRDRMGGDIMIHGNSVSAGCLAMGDPAAEDLFVLAARTGLENINVILSPYDFRAPGAAVSLPTTPDWLADFYAQIRAELQRYPLPFTGSD